MDGDHDSDYLCCCSTFRVQVESSLRKYFHESSINSHHSIHFLHSMFVCSILLPGSCVLFLLWIGSCAKLAPRFCGPFTSIERIGPVVYGLALPLKVKVHDVFHMSLLKKYVVDVDPRGFHSATNTIPCGFMLWDIYWGKNGIIYRGIYRG